MKAGPCKGCTVRTLGCHSTCKGYIEWKEEHNRMVELQKVQKSYEVHPYDFLGTSPPPGKHIEKRKKRYGRR